MISDAQRRLLSMVPDDWANEPLLGDSRPVKPLMRKGLIENRSFDVTPAEWEPSAVRVVRLEWRRTEAGRRALTEGTAE